MSALAPSPTWSSAIGRWCRWMGAGGMSEQTVQLRRRILHAFAAAHLEQGPWDVTTRDLTLWLQDRATETTRSYRNTFVGFYRWACTAGLTDQDPTRNLSAVPEGTPRPRPVRDADYTAALALAPGERERLMLRLAAELGLRRGEVAQVHRRDLLGEPGLWLLVVHGKGAVDRDLPVPDELAEAIVAATGPDGWAFPSPHHNRRHLSPRWVGALVSSLLPDGVTMHALRHRFATRTYDLHHDLLVVQELLGHASANTTRRYVQTPAIAMRHVVEQLERAR